MAWEVPAPTTLELLRALEGLPLRLVKLIPVIYQKGFVTAKVVEGEGRTVIDLDGDQLDTKEVHELVVKGLLTAETVDRVLVCPNCLSAKLRARLYCPYCGSLDVELTRVVQHILCGFTDLEARFREAGWVCPNCGSRIDPSHDFIEIGRVYYCNSCRKSFSRPNIQLVCNGCGNEFDLEDAKSVPVVRYSLTHEGRKVKELAIDLLYGAARAVEDSGHTYSLLRTYSRGGTERVVPLSIEGGLCIDVSDVLREALAVEYAAKKGDLTDVCRVYVVISRGYGGKSEAMLKVAGIRTFKASDAEQAYEVVSKILSELTGEGSSYKSLSHSR